MISKERKSGVLLPIFSLPGCFGIGTMGKGARTFLQKIKEAGFALWQTLPLCPPDGYGSPYAGRSSFAGDPDLIDPDEMVAVGLLTPAEAEGMRLPETGAVDRGALSPRRAILLSAAERADRSAVEDFLHQNPNTAAYCQSAAEREGGDPYAYAFLQYEFFREWDALRREANRLGIEVVGDMPIYSSPESYDVLAYPDAFDKGSDGKASAVAGAPPDAFSCEGQSWGNPLYDYAAMANDGFSYLKERTAFLAARFDGIRLDHFRGYSAYYAVPRDKSARFGEWREGPGQALFDTLLPYTDGRTVIAEDLGAVDEATETLRARNGFLSTRVLQFAFLGDPMSPHLPHNCTVDTAVYSGTHDNPPLAAYLREMPEGEKGYLLRYCGAGSEEEAGTAIIDTLLRSSARLAVFPLCDLLGEGAEARINTPGRAEGNWRYRVSGEALASLNTEDYLFRNLLYGRK